MTFGPMLKQKTSSAPASCSTISINLRPNVNRIESALAVPKAAPAPAPATPGVNIPHKTIVIAACAEEVSRAMGNPTAAAAAVLDRDDFSSSAKKMPGLGGRSWPGRKVRFDARSTTAVWPADSNYDRRSIVVDLSKTPFALFRKDALLMAKPTAVAGTATGPFPPSTANLRTIPRNADVAIVSPQTSALRAGATERTAIATATTCAAEGGRDSPPPNDACTLRRAELCYSWDSEESDGSCVTDNETDNNTEHSETDSNPCCERRSVEPAFFGVWKRTASEGYEALLLSSGVPKRAATTALRKHPIHIIDHDGTYFRLIVKNGLSKVDNTFFIGDEPRTDKIGAQTYEISMNWVDLSGSGQRDELALSSICVEKGEEVIAIRSLLDGGNSMVLTQVVRRPAENYEVRAKHYFKRVTDRSELRSSGNGQQGQPSNRRVTVCRRAGKYDEKCNKISASGKLD